MPDINALLLLRVGFLLGLYLFLFFVARAAWRELRSPQPSAVPAGELTVLDPARSRWQAGSRIAIESGASIGREPGNHVIVDEDTVSARHAVLRYDGRRWWVEDLGSTNGTFVNQQPVVQPVPVRNGDEVRFGRVAMRFAVDGTSSGRS